jgi:hypothetical protein
MKRHNDDQQQTHPIPAEMIEELYDWLMSSRYIECDHTLRRTVAFLDAKQLPFETVAWLKQHGGNCDCEVLFNICLGNPPEAEHGTRANG